MRNLSDLIASFGRGDARIDLDHAELLLPDSSRVALGVPAFVILKDRRLRLHLRETSPVKLAPAALSAFAKDISVKVITAADHLSIEAITDQGLPVLLGGVIPRFRDTVETGISGGGSITHRVVDFYRLALLPIGQEGMTPTERREENVAMGVMKADATGASWPQDEEESFYALIPSVKLELLNGSVTKTTKHPYHRREGYSGTMRCYTGAILGGEYCLEQTEEGDLAISFRRKISSANAALALKAVSEGFLAAVGLLHACNPWPYYYSQWRERRLVKRWLKAPADCQRDCLKPLRVGILDPNAGSFFEKAVEFFAEGGADAEYYREALWLMREVCRDGAPLEIKMITLCSILEGVAKRFTKSGKQIGDENAWRAALAKADIPWASGFDSVYESYCAYRNNLAHGFDPHPEDEKSPSIVFNAYSRITAGIYILMAKRMGFTGTLWRSRLEGGATISLMPRREAPPPP